MVMATGYRGISPNVAFDMQRPPYETYSDKPLIGGGGLMGEATQPAPTPAPAPAPSPTTPVQTPSGPMPTVPPGGVAPTPVPAPAPQVTPQVASPNPNWSQNVQRPAGQAPPPPPVTPSTPIIPPGYTSSPLGTNPNIGASPNMQGTGAAGVGDFRGAFNAGDRDAVTRTVQDNELSGNQLNDLIRGDSQYIRNARIAAGEAAAERGMLMSSVGVGMGVRGAIDAAQPFAMQQADAYGRTASENMAAENADAQADQGQYRDMAARDIALRAQMEDASLGRQFAAGQAQNEQAWRSGESYLDRQFQQGENTANRNFQNEQAAFERAWRSDEALRDRYQQTTERLGAQEFQSGETAYDRAWRDYQAAMDRAQQTNERYGAQDFQRAMSEAEQGWRSGEAALDRTYNSEQASLNRNEQRYGTYFNMIANREQQLATVLNGIYSNPNLTPQQQAQAAANARAVLSSVTDGYNTVMANGIPPIFANPYPMQFQPQTAQPTQSVSPLDPGYVPPTSTTPPTQQVPWRNLNGIAAP